MTHPVPAAGQSRPPHHDLDFLLQKLQDDTPGLVWAIAMAADGLPLASTHGVSDDDRDRLSAVGSGLTSLLASISRTGAGPVQSNLTYYAHGYLMLMSISNGASLLIYAELGCDLAAVSHEMTMLINRVGPLLTPTAAGTLALTSRGR
jgi:predicted regulator of Ras-like GTPase activity (Roadblock/LC7/MglB family)